MSCQIPWMTHFGRIVPELAQLLGQRVTLHSPIGRSSLSIVKMTVDRFYYQNMQNTCPAHEMLYPALGVTNIYQVEVWLCIALNAKSGQ